MVNDRALKCNVFIIEAETKLAFCFILTLTNDILDDFTVGISYANIRYYLNIQ